MSRAECAREQEVLDAIAANRWPDRLERDLANHIEGCAFCKELGIVARMRAREQPGSWCSHATWISAKRRGTKLFYGRLRHLFKE